jgi:hypothetical protein
VPNVVTSSQSQAKLVDVALNGSGLSVKDSSAKSSDVVPDATTSTQPQVKIVGIGLGTSTLSVKRSSATFSDIAPDTPPRSQEKMVNVSANGSGPLGTSSVTNSSATFSTPAPDTRTLSQPQARRIEVPNTGSGISTITVSTRTSSNTASDVATSSRPGNALVSQIAVPPPQTPTSAPLVLSASNDKLLKPSSASISSTTFSDVVLDAATSPRPQAERVDVSANRSDPLETSSVTAGNSSVTSSNAAPDTGLLPQLQAKKVDVRDTGLKIPTVAVSTGTSSTTALDIAASSRPGNAVLPSVLRTAVSPPRPRMSAPLIPQTISASSDKLLKPSGAAISSTTSSNVVPNAAMSPLPQAEKVDVSANSSGLLVTSSVTARSSSATSSTTANIGTLLQPQVKRVEVPGSKIPTVSVSTGTSSTTASDVATSSQPRNAAIPPMLQGPVPPPIPLVPHVQTIRGPVSESLGNTPSNQTTVTNAVEKNDGALQQQSSAKVDLSTHTATTPGTTPSAPAPHAQLQQRLSMSTQQSQLPPEQEHQDVRPTQPTSQTTSVIPEKTLLKSASVRIRPPPFCW